MAGAAGAMYLLAFGTAVERRLAELLLGRFPPHTCYVEVFAGGAALYFMRAPADGGGQQRRESRPGKV